MKRALVAVVACLSLAIGAVEMAPTPAAAASFSFGFGFGGPGPYPFYPGPFHPHPFFGGQMYQYQYPRAHQVCYPVVKLRKYVRHHRVHWRKVVVTVCSWQYW